MILSDSSGLPPASSRPSLGISLESLDKVATGLASSPSLRRKFLNDTSGCLQDLGIEMDDGELVRLSRCGSKSELLLGVFVIANAIAFANVFAAANITAAANVSVAANAVAAANALAVTNAVAQNNVVTRATPTPRPTMVATPIGGALTPNGGASSTGI